MATTVVPLQRIQVRKGVTLLHRRLFQVYGILCNLMQAVCSAIKHDHEAAHVAHNSVI